MHSIVMECVNVFDYEALAEARLDPATWAFLAGGAGDEVTLRANRSAFERLQLRPRALIDVSKIDTSTTVLGIPVKTPILLAPTGWQGLAHPEGECATARAIGMAGTVMAVSSYASRTLEQIANTATGPLWFQLSLNVPSRAISEQLVRRATQSGYRAIILTVDSPRSDRKERAERQGFHLPSSPANFQQTEGETISGILTWEDLSWLRALTPLPLLLKGILSAEDARLAVEHGVDGIIVSNHGGRQLDGVPATIEVLPEIVEAVKGLCEVYLDSGIRRGTDILKALALGTQAVLIGRPVLWGLAANGTDGVVRILEMVRAELELAMALAGRPTLASIDSSLLRMRV